MIEARKNRLFERLFLAYTRRLMRNHFSGVHLGGLEHLNRIDRTLPVIIYCNHSNWWDAMLAFLLAQEVFDRDMYAMMEEKQLHRYRFFRRIGVFSVVRESPRQAVESMHYAASLLGKPNAGLWIFPQGVMVPNDVRPLKFYPGAARIAAMVGRAQFVPVAHRYEFIMEQRPEAFTLIGEPWVPGSLSDVKALTEELEKRLTALLDTLRCDVVNGSTQEFKCLLAGRSSVNARYDTFRTIRRGA